jgi:hypothetical protein
VLAASSGVVSIFEDMQVSCEILKRRFKALVESVYESQNYRFLPVTTQRSAQHCQ